MNTKELREKTLDELKAELIEQLQHKLKLRMQAGMGEMPRPHLLVQARRDIARIKTIINEKEARS